VPIAYPNNLLGLLTIICILASLCYTIKKVAYIINILYKASKIIDIEEVIKLSIIKDVLLSLSTK